MSSKMERFGKRFNSQTIFREPTSEEFAVKHCIEIISQHRETRKKQKAQAKQRREDFLRPKRYNPTQETEQ